jgi:hypothetical protein
VRGRSMLRHKNGQGGGSARDAHWEPRQLCSAVSLWGTRMVSSSLEEVELHVKVAGPGWRSVMEPKRSGSPERGVTERRTCPAR